MSDRHDGAAARLLRRALDVTRTFELTHVDPEHDAVALCHAPERVFRFVSDAVAFESYPSTLRGPRGTLRVSAGS